MFPVLTSEQMRALDKHAIEKLGIPGIVLMENAALAVLSALEEKFGELEGLLIAVVCGPGNNGGDGCALARHLHLHGADVDIFSVVDPAQLTGDAQINYRITEALDIPLIRLDIEPDELAFEEYDLVIDALFGTGSLRKPDGVIATTIEAINEAGVPVVSIDLPSGVDATTAQTPGEAVNAFFTVALEHPKVGHLLPPGRDHCGDVIVSTVSIPDPDDDTFEFDFLVPEDDDVAELLPPREPTSHKGDYGRLLVVAGSRGMSGAAHMVATAALRSGIGLVRIACPESIRAEIAGAIREAVTIGLPETADGGIADSAIETLKNYLDWPEVIAVGPGLKTEEETGLFLKDLFSIFRACKFVIDADALNLITAADLFKHIPEQAILTPHPGEFARLQHAEAGGTLEKSSLTRSETSLIVHRSSFESLRSFSTSLSHTVVLKGSPTLTASDGPLIINPTGNPGLATGGTGDVLTGIISALWAQGLDEIDAAWVGSYIHGRAADIAVESIGELSLVAGDVIRYLPAAFRSITSVPDPHES